MSLFDAGPATPKPGELSDGQRRTLRAEGRLAAGVHPMTRVPLANNGESCGTCANLERHGGGNRSYFKCGLVANTSGPGTDIRMKWPACNLWSDS